MLFKKFFLKLFMSFLNYVNFFNYKVDFVDFLFFFQGGIFSFN